MSRSCVRAYARGTMSTTPACFSPPRNMRLKAFRTLWGVCRPTDGARDLKETLPLLKKLVRGGRGGGVQREGERDLQREAKSEAGSEFLSFYLLFFSFLNSSSITHSGVRWCGGAAEIRSGHRQGGSRYTNPHTLKCADILQKFFMHKLTGEMG